MSEEEHHVHRVLIANRGEIARRLTRYFQARGIEVVLAFAECEAELTYLDEADYAVYLNGQTVDETYRNIERVVAASHDSGVDAIHPGYCFLAERVDFFETAMAANMPVFGPDLDVLRRVVDRTVMRHLARHLGVPLIPGTSSLPDEEDPMAAAAQIGVPLFVKANSGQVLERVETLEDVADAVQRVRARAMSETGRGEVYLERAVESLRQVGTLVVADRHNTVMALGHTDLSLEYDYCTWVEDLGPEVVSAELAARLSQAAEALAREVGWVGVGRVQWAVQPDGGWYFLGFAPRLTTGYSLAELVFGVDLVDAQVRCISGEPLDWDHADTAPAVHAVQLRIFHGDHRDGSRPSGILHRLEIPKEEGVLVELGAEEGQELTENHDPLLAKVTVSGPTRQAAIVRARTLLDSVHLEGIPSNLAVLKAALEHPTVWLGSHDVTTVAALISGEGFESDSTAG